MYLLFLYDLSNEDRHIYLPLPLLVCNGRAKGGEEPNLGAGQLVSSVQCCTGVQVYRCTVMGGVHCTALCDNGLVAATSLLLLRTKHLVLTKPLIMVL